MRRLLRLQSMASQCAPHQGSAVVLTASCYDLLPPPSWSHLVLQRLGTQLRQRQHNETCYHLALVVDDEFCPGRCAALMPPGSSLAASATCHDFASSLHSPIAVNARQLPGTNWRRFRDRHGKEQSIIQHALLNRNVLHTMSSLEQRGFKRIWYVEMDVAFTGNWGDLLRRYDAPPLDSIDILSPDPLGACSTTDSFCSKTMWSGNLPDHTYHGSTYNKARARGSPSYTPGARADGRAFPPLRPRDQIQLFLVRFSGRLVRLVLSKLAKGLVAHVELLWPTLCTHHLQECTIKMLDAADFGDPWNCCTTCDSALRALRHWSTLLLGNARRSGGDRLRLPPLPLLGPEGALGGAEHTTERERYDTKLLHPMKLEKARVNNLTSCEGALSMKWVRWLKPGE